MPVSEHKKTRLHRDTDVESSLRLRWGHGEDGRCGFWRA